MKFTCTQQNLSRGLTIAEKIIGKNFTLPILQNILLNCENEKRYIKLSSTDLEMGIEVIIPAKTEEGGSITVPAKLISGFVRNLPEENIDFSEKNKKVSIQCENYKSNIKGQDSKEFPIIPKDQNSEIFSTKSDDFIFGLSSVINSVSLSDIKPELSGILVQFRKEDMCFTATDSFRLAEKSIKNLSKNNYLNKIIIPKRMCEVIIRIFQDVKDAIDIQVNGNQITIKNFSEDTTSPKIRLVGKIIDGEYPNYEQIIPDNFTTEIKTEKNELIRHIKTASLFSTKIQEIIFQTDFKNQHLEIMAKDQEYGDHQSVLLCKIEGKDEKIVLNFQYLLDGIQNISSETVVLKINQPTTPVLISSLENEGFKYILMPIKI